MTLFVEVGDVSVTLNEDGPGAVAAVRAVDMMHVSTLSSAPVHIAMADEQAAESLRPSLIAAEKLTRDDWMTGLP